MGWRADQPTNSMSKKIIQEVSKQSKVRSHEKGNSTLSMPQWSSMNIVICKVQWPLHRYRNKFIQVIFQL